MLRAVVVVVEPLPLEMSLLATSSSRQSLPTPNRTHLTFSFFLPSLTIQQGSVVQHCNAQRDISLYTHGVWLLMPLMNRAMLLRRSGQIDEAACRQYAADSSVIMLSPSSCSRLRRKSTSPTYSLMMVRSQMERSASTVNPSTGSYATTSGGHSPLAIIHCHVASVSASSLASTCIPQASSTARFSDRGAMPVWYVSSLLRRLPSPSAPSPATPSAEPLRRVRARAEGQQPPPLLLLRHHQRAGGLTFPILQLCQRRPLLDLEDIHDLRLHQRELCGTKKNR